MNISGRTEWSIHSLERDVEAFRPKNGYLIVWHFPRTISRNTFLSHGLNPHGYRPIAAMRLIKKINPSFIQCAGGSLPKKKQ